MKNNNDWPVYIRSLIEKAGLTQAKFAREIGVEQATITRWLNGSARPRAGLTQRAVEEFAKNLQPGETGPERRER